MKNYKEYDPEVTAKRLRQSISEAGMTQKVFAEQVGIPKRTCEAYLSGISTPSVKKLFTFSLELGVTADYLMGLTDETLT